MCVRDNVIVIRIGQLLKIKDGLDREGSKRFLSRFSLVALLFYLFFKALYQYLLSCVTLCKIRLFFFFDY